MELNITTHQKDFLRQIVMERIYGRLEQLRSVPTWKEKYWIFEELIELQQLLFDLDSSASSLSLEKFLISGEFPVTKVA